MTTPRSHSYKNITDHVEKISSLKKKALDLMYNRLEIESGQCEAVTKIVCKMREIHGCSIYDYYKCLEYISKKGAENVTRKEWEILSADKSLLRIMHNAIRCVEKKLYANIDQSDRSGSSYTQSPVTPRSKFSRKSDYGNVYGQYKAHYGGADTSVNPVSEIEATKLKINEAGELSIVNKPEDSMSEYSLTPYDNLFRQTGGNNSTDDTPVPTLGDSTLASLAREDPSPLSSLFGGKPETFDKTKPTVISIWANWCGYSRKFKETGWKEFKKLYENDRKCKDSNVQCLDIDVGRDPKTLQLFKDHGINSYPTTVIVHGSMKLVLPKGSQTTGGEILSGVHQLIENR